ncbi:hypothetical protein K469DRAFT_695313 [Zopfia rhizophila CBS 207.26]|uniref:Uncharacterized protein n=1 Tax=Zopfia rhizophila CBS 207.26 TaxID=1314779 RepID=A0A6A6DJ89_9PEZI|nr:hypothetical protein K469DRAFT_695313 [Zopfia rhizophila CBS 207.26]
MFADIIPLALLTVQIATGAIIARHYGYEEPEYRSSVDYKDYDTATVTSYISVPPGQTTGPNNATDNVDYEVVTVMSYTTVRPASKSEAKGVTGSVVFVTVTNYTTVYPTSFPSGASSGGYLPYPTICAPYRSPTSCSSSAHPSNPGFVGIPGASSGSYLVDGIPTTAPYMNTSAHGGAKSTVAFEEPSKAITPAFSSSSAAGIQSTIIMNQLSTCEFQNGRGCV